MILRWEFSDEMPLRLQNRVVSQKLRRIQQYKMEIAESLDAVALEQKESGPDRRDFMLTEAQRGYIQHHLPRFFTLVPMRHVAMKGRWDSKSNIEDSQPCLVVERKRGRPEGSTKKGPRFYADRKMKRADSISSIRASARKKKSNNSQSESDRSEESQQENDFVKEGPVQSISLLKSLDQPSEALPVLFNESGSEEQMAKTCKESQGEVEVGAKNKAKEGNNDNLKTNQNVQSERPQGNKRGPKPKKRLSKAQSQEGSVSEALAKKEQLLPRDTFQAQKIILRRLKAHREIFPFLQPVNEQRDGAPDYYKQITTPINVQTIEFKLKSGIYKLKEEFHADVRLMWANSKSYNRNNPLMQRKTEQLEAFYHSILARPKSMRRQALSPL